MANLWIGWWYNLFLLVVIQSFNAYGNEKAEEIFEKTQEEKVDATTTFL